MFEALIASLIVSLMSLAGVFFFRKSGHMTGSHRFIVPVAMGVFLGVIFFDLIPETIEAAGTYGSMTIIVGFLAFYLLSHILRTYHHHHNSECSHGSGAMMLLIGDSIHNIADGVVIASAFLISPTVGIATTVGIALHEIPQEIAQFGVLLRAGYSTRKAAIYNLLSALSIVLGVLFSMLFLKFGDYLWILTGLAAGNLLYITASDMIPELNSSEHAGHFMQTFISTILGLVFIIILLNI